METLETTETSADAILGMVCVAHCPQDGVCVARRERPVPSGLCRVPMMNFQKFWGYFRRGEGGGVEWGGPLWSPGVGLKDGCARATIKALPAALAPTEDRPLVIFKLH